MFTVDELVFLSTNYIFRRTRVSQTISNRNASLNEIYERSGSFFCQRLWMRSWVMLSSNSRA